MSDQPDCPFCEYAAGVAEPAGGIEWLGDVMVFTPLKPFAHGHKLVVPTEHTDSLATASFETIGRVMWAVAGTVARSCVPGACGAADGSPQANVITSIGAYATQTVMHLHVHIVPRHGADIFRNWPWRTDADMIAENRNDCGGPWCGACGGRVEGHRCVPVTTP